MTAIYEITPKGENLMIDTSRYTPTATIDQSASSELGYFKLRYKLPQSSTSSLIEIPITKDLKPKTPSAKGEVNFAVAVAGFSQLLKGGKYTGKWEYEDALALAQANKGEDLFGYRTELVQLIRKAQTAHQL